MKINKVPCHIIQVFTNSYEYAKDYKNFDTRKNLVQWKPEIPSETIFDDKLLISNDCYNNRVGVLDNLIILKDSNFYTYQDYLNILKLKNFNHEDNDDKKLDFKNNNKLKEPLILGALRGNLQSFEIFKFRFNNEIELFIDWNYWAIGSPKRDSFKIAELKVGQPLNIKINGKRDFSLTGRRNRVFLEKNYIIEYKGVCNEVDVLRDNKNYIKKIPDNIKIIDLIKNIK